MTSKSLLDKYWDNFYKTCLDRHDPFEKYINEIYDKEICISPIKSLSLHKVALVENKEYTQTCTSSRLRIKANL